MAVLEVKNLTKSFGQTSVLRGVDFTLEDGEVLSVIGSSGGGKTTLLRCLNFLETPDSGSIVVNGEELFALNPDGTPRVAKNGGKYMGLVFQQFNLFPQYSVLDNLTLAPRLAAKSRPDYKQKKREIITDIEARARELLATTGLADKAASYPCQLSGGQQQRVAIARALMMSPRILCFDEPTSALDPELTGEVLRVIRSLKEQGHTMIVVTHELAFAEGVSDKVMFMSEGVVEEYGTPDRVLRNPQSEKTRAFLGAMKENSK